MPQVSPPHSSSAGWYLGKGRGCSKGLGIRFFHFSLCYRNFVFQKMTHFRRQLSSRASKRIVGEKLPIKSASNDAMRFVALIFDLIIAALIAFTCDYFFHFEEKTPWIFFGILMVLRDSLLQGGSLGKRICGLIIVDFYSLKPLSRMRCIQRQCLFYGGMGTLVFLGYALSQKM